MLWTVLWLNLKTWHTWCKYWLLRWRSDLHLNPDRRNWLFSVNVNFRLGHCYFIHATINEFVLLTCSFGIPLFLLRAIIFTTGRRSICIVNSWPVKLSSMDLFVNSNNYLYYYIKCCDSPSLLISGATFIYRDPSYIVWRSKNIRVVSFNITTKWSKKIILYFR